MCETLIFNYETQGPATEHCPERELNILFNNETQDPATEHCPQPDESNVLPRTVFV